MSDLVWADYLAKGPLPTRRSLIGGNWKCNGTLSKVKAMVDVLNKSGAFPATSEVVIAIPSLYLLRTKDMFRDDVKIAAQDVGLFGNGAYTGEQSAEMLMDSGIKWTLTGHSERRTGFGYTGETSEVVAKKTKGAVDQGMNVIVCIGEQLSDREAGMTMTVLASMLEPCVDAMTENDWNKCVIAYEPVWAIGTGKVATPEQAEETHAEIRAYIAEKVSIEVAKKIRIIYGGSVKGSNCSTLIKCDNIDGFLVGGASLKPEFVDIINCTKFRM